MRIFNQLALMGILLITNVMAEAASSIGLGYTPKYPANFKHFDYVNPDAPKRGDLVLNGNGNFDSFNYFALKGVKAEPQNPQPARRESGRAGS